MQNFHHAAAVKLVHDVLPLTFHGFNALRQVPGDRLVGKAQPQLVEDGSLCFESIPYLPATENTAFRPFFGLRPSGSG